MKLTRWGLAVACVLIGAAAISLNAQGARIGINVVTNTAVTDAIVADLGRYGAVTGVIPEINGVTLRGTRSAIAAIAARPYVAAVNADAERKGTPIDTVPASNFSGGINVWNLDAVNVTDLQTGPDRTIGYDGTGVYVAVLDSGLLDSWRQYFPQERIATQFAKAFASPIEHSSAEPTNQWEHDQNSHGTHVTSIILGYAFGTTPINGVAPKATVIPIKVLGQTGGGFTSMIAKGIVYVTNLKTGGALGTSPLVINMSLGGSVLDALEKAAIDYAVANGVAVVAAAGNEGEDGMSYPGAYEATISVAASGWSKEWTTGTWWRALDVADPTNPADFYIPDFSSREKTGQSLDVAAPGSWVVGPYQSQSGKTSYSYVGGTSQATPHVSGIVALMLQKNGALNPGAIESILESTAIPLAPGCMKVIDPFTGQQVDQCWGADATGFGLATANAALAGTH